MSQQTGASQNHLRAERDRFVAFAFAASDILIEVDADRRVTYAAGATHGLADCGLVGMTLADLVAAEDRARLTAALDAIPRGGRMKPMRLRLVGAGLPPVIASGYHLPDLANHYYLALAFERAATVAPPATAEPAARDPETGLLGKEAFGSTVSERLERARAAGETCELTLFDLEPLAALRDHAAADAVDGLIANIGETLRAHAVDDDAAGRFDAETFGLVHDHGLDIDALKARIAAAAGRLDPTGDAVEIRAATVDLDAAEADPQDVAKAVVYTINKFSENEGDAFSIASLKEGCDLMVRETMSQMTEFKSLVANNRFDIALQPIVDLASRKVHHYEALARFQGPRGPASPFSLITFAEETGVIGEFDLAMTRRVVDLVDDAHRRGGDLRLAVNLSGRSLGSPAFIDDLLALLKAHPASRHKVWFEVTESAKIADLKATNDLIQQLRAAGHGVCLDDFGAGASAFQYLRALAVDVVKIDGIYVREAFSSPTGKPFLKAMAGLCCDLGIAVVAEMVEDEQTASLLRECGVRFGQGYLFGKPVPAPDPNKHGGGEIIRPPATPALKRSEG